MKHLFALIACVALLALVGCHGGHCCCKDGCQCHKGGECTCGDKPGECKCKGCCCSHGHSDESLLLVP